MSPGLATVLGHIYINKITRGLSTSDPGLAGIQRRDAILIPDQRECIGGAGNGRVIDEDLGPGVPTVSGGEDGYGLMAHPRAQAHQVPTVGRVNEFDPSAAEWHC